MQDKQNDWTWKALFELTWEELWFYFTEYAVILNVMWLVSFYSKYSFKALPFMTGIGVICGVILLIVATFREVKKSKGGQ